MNKTNTMNIGLGAYNFHTKLEFGHNFHQFITVIHCSWQEPPAIPRRLAIHFLLLTHEWLWARADVLDFLPLHFEKKKNVLAFLSSHKKILYSFSLHHIHRNAFVLHFSTAHKQFQNSLHTIWIAGEIISKVRRCNLTVFCQSHCTQFYRW